MKTVITYGTFDLLHTGHVNLLKRARALGDRLIVGVTTDSYDQSRGKLNVLESLEERVENVRKTGLADLIITEELEGQKLHDIQKYGADIFVIGSDWTTWAMASEPAHTLMGRSSNASFSSGYFCSLAITTTSGIYLRA